MKLSEILSSKVKNNGKIFEIAEIKNWKSLIVETNGRDYVYACGIKNITGITAEEITLNDNTLSVKVLGSVLTVSDINENEIIINGKIENIAFGEMRIEGID